MKRYNSLTDIIGSPEFDAFIERSKTTGNSLLDKIAKKKGLKITKPIDFSTNIVTVANEFYNSIYNEIEEKAK